MARQGRIEVLEFLAHVRVWRIGAAKAGRAQDDVVDKRSRLGLSPGVNPVANRAALHEHDGMMPVLARDRRGQSRDKSRLCPTGHEFKTVRRDVMTLIDDEMPITA